MHWQQAVDPASRGQGDCGHAQVRPGRVLGWQGGETCICARCSASCSHSPPSRRGFDVYVNMVLEDVIEYEITPEGQKVSCRACLCGPELGGGRGSGRGSGTWQALPRARCHREHALPTRHARTGDEAGQDPAEWQQHRAAGAWWEAREHGLTCSGTGRRQAEPACTIPFMTPLLACCTCSFAS